MVNRNKKIIISVILSFFASITIFCDRSSEICNKYDFLQKINGNIVCTSIVFGTLVWAYYNFLNKSYNKKVIIYSFVLTVVFSLCELIGFYMDKYSAFFNLYMNLYTKLFNIGIFLGYISLIFPILTIIITFFTQKGRFSKTSNENKYKYFSDNIHSVIAVTLFLCIVWGICYIIFYPGVVTWDSYYQIEQGLGNVTLTDEHPFLHTLIEGGIIKLGILIFGNINAGIAFFTFIQMCIIAIIISLVIRYLARKQVPSLARFIVLMFYGFHPVIAIYSVTLWKDVWMGIFVLVYIIFLFEISTNADSFFKSKLKIFLFALLVLCILFAKGTGIIIIMITIPTCFIFAKKQWKYLLIISLTCLSAFLIIRNIAINEFNIKPGHVREPFSVPLQQIARLVKYHKDDLTDYEYQTINEILPIEDLSELYNPKLSDNVKGQLNEERFKNEMLKYASLWIKLGVKHPYTYFDSFLANSYGYWYPETIYWEVSSSDWINMLDFYKSNDWTINDDNYNNYNISYTKQKIKEDFSNIVNNYIRKVPIINLLFSIAMYFWIHLVCMIISIIKRKYNLIPIFLTILSIFLICIGSPVHAEFRYAYAALTTLPISILYTICDCNNNHKYDKLKE